MKKTNEDGRTERNDIDRRRFEAEDNSGHIKGSKQSEFSEKKAQSAEQKSNSNLNKQDQRGTINNSGRSDLL